MSDILKSIINDLINDRVSQATISMHDYIVASMRDHIGINESIKETSPGWYVYDTTSAKCVAGPLSAESVEAKVAALSENGKIYSTTEVTRSEAARARQNRGMKPDSVSEGTFVIKSKDGVEKRFKKTGPESDAWAKTVAKKPAGKFEKYSKAYWEREEQKAWDKNASDFVLPWDPIDRDALDPLSLRGALMDAGFTSIEDYSIIGKSYTLKDGDMPVAAIKLNVQVVHDLTADFGYDQHTIDAMHGVQDGKVLDLQGIVVARDTKDPKKMVFKDYF